MTDASILIPTHRHTALLPYAIRSALDQDGASVEVLVVGDGVEDETREIVAGFADPRVRFFDFPKGERLGEAHRHSVLQQAAGRIASYLADDDLLLRDHAAEMGRLLENADFAHSVSAHLAADDVLEYFPWNMGRSEFQELARPRRGSIGLTGVAHTLEAYRRLPHGWRTTPNGMPTDHYMWIQWLDLPDFRGVMGDRLTYLTFPDPLWGQLPEEERAEALASWLRRSREPGFDQVLDRMLREAIRRAAEDYHVWARTEQLALETLKESRAWRLRERLIRIGPLRALLARRPGAR